MKKLDFLLREGREALTRDQMKSVTGGELYAVEATCSFNLSDGGAVNIDCNSYSISECRDWTVHNMASLCEQAGSTYGGGLHCE